MLPSGGWHGEECLLAVGDEPEGYEDDIGNGHDGEREPYEREVMVADGVHNSRIGGGRERYGEDDVYGEEYLSQNVDFT